MPLPVLPNGKEAGLLSSRFCSVCLEDFCNLKVKQLQLLLRSVLFHSTCLSAHFSSYSLRAIHLKLFLKFLPKQRMIVLRVLLLNTSLSEVHSFQRMPLNIVLPTCNIMHVYTARCGVCFDPRFAKWGISPPSFQNHKDPLYCSYFHLPQDQVTLIKAFRGGCVGWGPLHS